jgi:hypothetical protein
MNELHPFKSSPRRMRNYLLDPRFQLKYSAYFLGFGLGAAISSQWLLLDFVRDVLVRLRSEIPANLEIMSWFDPSISSLSAKFSAFVVIFSLACFAFGVFVTHRIVGPVVAIRRHIHALGDGNYLVTTRLRRKDYLAHIAQDLNELSAKLQAQHGVGKTRTPEKPTKAA